MLKVITHRVVSVLSLNCYIVKTLLALGVV